ncbi:MAG: hypothetical protein ACK55I_28200, partial [bacterium]
VDLERSQAEQHRQRILAAAVDGGADERVTVDPRQEIRRQRDALGRAGIERTLARRLHMLADPRRPSRGTSLQSCGGPGRRMRRPRQSPDGHE